MSQCQEILQSQSEDSPPRLSIEDALVLYQEANLTELMHVASIHRRLRVPGNHVTYLVDRNVNYTNVCTINCQFCSFYRPPGHPETYLQTVDQISERITQLEEIGGSRILMQGGVHPDLVLEWYTDLIRELRIRHPSIDLDCFSPIEIEGISDICGLSTNQVLEELRAAGMHGLPGGGAEMLVDEVRLDISPKKGSAENWLQVMREAQELGLTTSATNVIGFGETNLHRLEHMGKVRELQDEALSRGSVGFTSFISWPVMLENNSLGRRESGTNKYTLGAGSNEYLRHVAISRLFFDNIKHIQASWPTMGTKIAQMALFAGADDIGSTMMEENVVSSSGTTKTSASERELQLIVSRAGFVPVKRDSDYNLLDTETIDEENFSPPPIQPN
ncbi:MAG: dehypoxanthine futalosine cyclase [Euryarchaeota archaeon]|nr:dehypoxanthine futalosine cyclase [Euryarchaeota archaeon]DAC37129.1 MAG TPA: CofH family radical SAM protein [Candidatus Poseidoniales archaeon]